MKRILSLSFNKIGNFLTTKISEINEFITLPKSKILLKYKDTNIILQIEYHQYNYSNTIILKAYSNTRILKVYPHTIILKAYSNTIKLKAYVKGGEDTYARKRDAKLRLIKFSQLFPIFKQGGLGIKIPRTDKESD